MKKIYLLFIAAVLTTNTFGGVIYTDLNPDDTYNNNSHSFDIDNDGSNEFQLDSYSDPVFNSYHLEEK